MNTPAEFDPQALKRDEEHLRLLSIFHFIMGGFALLGLAFMFVHYAIMKSVIQNADQSEQFPEAFWQIMIVVYVVMGVVSVLAAVANILSGLFLRRRQNRLFSQIIAGLNCLQVPLGTALGIFTFIVLSRPSVRARYEASAS